VRAPTFVTGTGRCGSTMLSNMLRDHPQVLSLSEFYSFISDFQARREEIFSRAPMDGPEFWDLLAAHPPHEDFALRQGFSPQTIYPCDAPSARYSAATGVPAILHVTLPHLTDDHDALFDTLGEEVPTWPTAPVGEHYERLFGWLARRFGKRRWIERSGAGLGFIDRLLEMFPDARFVHLVRDGRDAALSMQEHAGFQFGLAMTSLEQHLGVDPILSSDRTHLGRLPPELRPFLPEQFDAEALRAFRTPLPLCGAFWSRQIDMGLKVLCALPADRVLTLRYEDFFHDPKTQLDTLAAFIGDEFVDEAWSTRYAATVRKPRSTWRDLPDEIAQVLTDACAPGFEQLRATGVGYA
jgi:hypothetical protein